jgi:hypothetical protein
MMMEIFILNEFWYPSLFSAIPHTGSTPKPGGAIGCAPLQR